MNPLHLQNRQTWDDRVRRGLDHTAPASSRDFKNPLAVVDECEWLEGNVAGKRVLCLAAGGGRHGVLFAAAGARVTVVDISPAMLELDRRIAGERGLQVKLIEASMDDLSMLPRASFDVVIQPVSTCYVPDIRRVYTEVARVTTAEGVYISQHKQPINLQADAVPSSRGRYELREAYCRSGPLPPVPEGSVHREAGTTEFLHRWEDLVGGLCRAGFVIEDLVEPRHADGSARPGTFAHRSAFVPPYVTVKARRRQDAPQERGRLWIPGTPG